MRVPRRRGELGRKDRGSGDAFLTPARIRELRDELEWLEKRARPVAIEEMQRLAQHGDFSENVAYQDAKRRLRGINTRMLVLRATLRDAVPIEFGPSPDGRARLGATVVVDVSVRGAVPIRRTYEIVGAQETDPSTGRISHLSPVGKALLGLKAGDVVQVGEAEYRVVEVK